MPKRVDVIQFEIIQKLRQIPGVSVWPTHEVGFGFPDLVVGCNKKNWLLEVKVPDGKLTRFQMDFHEKWFGQCAVVHSWEEAFKAIGIKV